MNRPTRLLATRLVYRIVLVRVVARSLGLNNEYGGLSRSTIKFGLAHLSTLPYVNGLDISRSLVKNLFLIESKADMIDLSLVD